MKGGKKKILHLIVGFMSGGPENPFPGICKKPACLFVFINARGFR